MRNVCPQRGQLLKTNSPIRSATRGSWQAWSVLAGRRPNRDSYFPSSVRRGNSTSGGSGGRPAVHAINPIRQCCHRQRSVFGPFFGGIDDQHNPPEPTGDRRAVITKYPTRAANIIAISRIPISLPVPSAPTSERRVLLAPPLRRDAEWRRGKSRRFHHASTEYEGALPIEALYESDFVSFESSPEYTPSASGGCASVVFD